MVQIMTEIANIWEIKMSVLCVCDNVDLKSKFTAKRTDFNARYLNALLQKIVQFEQYIADLICPHPALILKPKSSDG